MSILGVERKGGKGAGLNIHTFFPVASWPAAYAHAPDDVRSARPVILSLRCSRSVAGVKVLCSDDLRMMLPIYDKHMWHTP